LTVVNRRVARALVVAMLLTGCGGGGDRPDTTTGHPTSPPDNETVGVTYYPGDKRDPAPTVSGATLAGPPLSLANIVGDRVVVVNVWASWCVECRAESRGLADLSTELPAGAVRFVGIDEQDGAAKARAFAAAAHATYSQLVDPDGTLLAEFPMLPSDGIPSTLVIDRQGRVAGRIIGMADEASLRQLIERVIANR
jgi:thiol-disulfide isomerase/thioredoxin